MGGLGTEKSKQPTYYRSPSFRNRLSFAEGIGTGAATPGADRRPSPPARPRRREWDRRAAYSAYMRRQAAATTQKTAPLPQIRMAAIGLRSSNGRSIRRSRHGQTQRNQDSLVGLVSAVPSPPAPLTPAAIHGPS